VTEPEPVLYPTRTRAPFGGARKKQQQQQQQHGKIVLSVTNAPADGSGAAAEADKSSSMADAECLDGSWLDLRYDPPWERPWD
jgi:hypothetical protein